MNRKKHLDCNVEFCYVRIYHIKWTEIFNSLDTYIHSLKPNGIEFSEVLACFYWTISVLRSKHGMDLESRGLIVWRVETNENNVYRYSRALSHTALNSSPFIIFNSTNFVYLCSHRFTKKNSELYAPRSEKSVHLHSP